MSNTSKNKYAKKAKQKALSGTSTAAAVETKHDIKKTLAYTGRDILLGAVGGGMAGAVVGRSSFLIGIAVTGAGHYFGSPSAAMFGVGMMASGGYQAVSTAMNGVEKDGVDGIKERFGNFKENLKRQLYLDKIIPKKKETKEKSAEEESTNGVGEVQYFNHQNNEEVNGNKDVDFSEADRLEKQIEESGREFLRKNGMSQNVSGTEHDDADDLKGEFEDRIM